MSTSMCKTVSWFEAEQLKYMKKPWHESIVSFVLFSTLPCLTIMALAVAIAAIHAGDYLVALTVMGLYWHAIEIIAFNLKGKPLSRAFVYKCVKRIFNAFN
jgi:hypothetical protein